MSNIKYKIKKRQVKIAIERIERLFEEAEKAALEGDIEFANEYVINARRISIRHNIPIPRELKRKFCKYCYHYLLPGVTSMVRINSNEKRVEIKCLNCGKRIYYPYIREVKERRRL